MDRIALAVLTFLAALVILITVLVSWGRAETAAAPPATPACQTASSCKIIVLSSEEEFALTGSNQILDTAMQGRPLDLSGKVLYFRDKLRVAPAGAPLPPPVAQSPDPQPPK